MMKPGIRLFLIITVALAAGIASTSAQDDGIELYIIGFDIAQGTPQEAELKAAVGQMGGVYLRAENAKTPEDLANALSQSYRGVVSQPGGSPVQIAATSEAEPNNEIGDATLVSVGQPVSGRIFPGRDGDFYQARLTSPGILRAKVTDAPKEMKARIDLYGKNFNYITRKDAENPGDDAILILDIGSPGQYYFGVGDLAGGSYSSNYTFALEFEPVVDFEPNGEIGDAITVQPNVSIKGYIFPGGDGDFYKVRLNSSGILEASLKDAPKAIAASMKGRIDLYGKNYNYLTRKDAENPGDDVTLKFDIASPGWYYFGIGDLNGKSYNTTYTFQADFKPVVEEPNGEIGDAIEIQSNEAVKGYIFPGGDGDFYKVYVAHAGPLEARLEDVPKSIKASMKGRIDLYGKNGNYITRKDAVNQGDDVILKFDITSAGWYYFGIGDLNKGSYDVGYIFRVST
jgi:hypothetical protein